MIRATLAPMFLVTAALAAVTGCTNPVDVEDAVTDAVGEEASGEEGALTASPACSADVLIGQAPSPERAAVLQRAFRWIDLNVLYQAGHTFEGYRKDCSGFVSMAWELGKPGASTAMMEPFSDHPQLDQIPLDSLVPGDALNRRTRVPAAGGGTIGHVRLFGGWVDKGAGTFCEIEEYSTGHPPRARLGGPSDMADYVGIRRRDLPLGAAVPPPAAPPPSTNTSGHQCGVLFAGEVLDRNESVTSCDGRFVFVHQGDGNVVLYGPGGVARWNSQTVGVPSSHLVMQEDGNFVLYSANGTALWHTHTFGHAGSFFAVLNDGNAAVVEWGVGMPWQTHTGG